MHTTHSGAPAAPPVLEDCFASSRIFWPWDPVMKAACRFRKSSSMRCCRSCAAFRRFALLASSSSCGGVPSASAGESACIGSLPSPRPRSGLLGAKAGGSGGKNQGLGWPSATPKFWASCRNLSRRPLAKPPGMLSSGAAQSLSTTCISVSSVFAGRSGAGDDTGHASGEPPTPPSAAPPAVKPPAGDGEPGGPAAAEVKAVSLGWKKASVGTRTHRRPEEQMCGDIAAASANNCTSSS
mmetsp:Transcript_138402/g.442280  ORF Transcript_138402/g.442280 Transcript_138402/m.442280 type:complete len:239 (+) Transcript_138402:2497-3213(+)